MSERKFFSGLPQRLEKRAGQGPDRQRTQFYWPDDENKPEVQKVTPHRRLSRSSSRDSSAWEMNSEQEQQQAMVKDRKNKQLQSRIEFYDFVDCENDNSNRKEPVQRNQPPVREVNYPKPISQDNYSNQDYDRKITVDSDLHQPEYEPIIKNIPVDNKNGKFNNNNKNDEIFEVQERIHEIKLENPQQQKTPYPKINTNSVNSKNYYENNDNESDDEYGGVDRKRQQPDYVRRENSRQSQQQLNRRPDKYRGTEWEDYDDRKVNARRPPRPLYEYEDEFIYPVRTSSRERFDLPPRPRPQYDNDYYSRPYDRRERPMPRRMTSNYDPDYYDDRYFEPPSPSTQPPPPQRRIDGEYDEPIDRDFYYEEPARETIKQNSISNGYTNNNNNSNNSTSGPSHNNKVYGKPPRPLRRTMSICSDAPSEISRAMSQRHLKSNIFFTDRELLHTQPRPKTIREFAANSKVCVGLPDID